MSCIVIDVPLPTRLLSAPSFANDHHSGPSESLLSEMTTPQVLQTNSPEFSSKTRDDLLQAGHLPEFDIFTEFLVFLP